MRLLLIILVFCLSLACKTTHREVTKSPPNIIVFLVDDMGWQDTSVPFWDRHTELNTQFNTPNMERLAAKGVKFTQAYATPVCSPSRVSLITGTNAARHRVTNWTLRKDVSQDRIDSILTFPQWNMNGLSPIRGIHHTFHATLLPQILKNSGIQTIHAQENHI